MQPEEVCGYLGRSVTATIVFGDRDYAICDVRVTIRGVDERYVTLTVDPAVCVNPEHEALWNEHHHVRLEKLLSLTMDSEAEGLT